MTMRNASIAMLLLCLLHSSVLTSAFMVARKSNGGTATRGDIVGSNKFATTLYYKDVEDNGYGLDPIDITTTRSVIEATSKISSDDIPDLPRSYVKKMTDLGEFPSDTMSEVEMVIGRVCMIASLWLIGNEILTGVGFADQIIGGIGKL